MDFLEKYNDKPCITTVARSDCQNWAIITFISPVDQSLKHSLKTIHEIYHNEGNVLLSEMTEKIHNILLNDITKRADSEIARYKLLKYDKDNHMIDNAISMLEYLKIKDDEFNVPQRLFTDTEDNLEYKFNNYIVANVEKLDSNYEKLHGKETNKRGIKISGVFSSKDKAQDFALNMAKEPTNKFTLPIGKWVPWRSYDINAPLYSITDSMCDELYELLQNNDNLFDKKTRDFYTRKDQLKKGNITM